MRRPLFLSLLAACFQLHAAVVEPPPAAPATLQELRDRFDAAVNHPRFAAGTWGVKVASLKTGVVLYEQNAAKLFSPASNSKLYTVALALTRLGPEYRIKTSLRSYARPDASGRLASDLVVYGRGDPGFTPRKHGGELAGTFAALVQALTNAGVRHVQGDLVGDSTFFRGPELGSGWTWDDPQYYYGAPINALTFNDNVLTATVQAGSVAGEPCKVKITPAELADTVVVSNRTTTAEVGRARPIQFYRVLGQNVLFVTGSLAAGDKPYSEDVTVHDPAVVFMRAFAVALKECGVSWEGRVRTVDWLSNGLPAAARGTDWIELGSVESAPLRELARAIQKPSQNLYTDLLLAHVGEQSRQANTPPERTSEELGIGELNRFCTQLGIRQDVFFEEGSGLSRNNLTTPDATMALLQHMARSTNASTFTDALPIAGVDGTLRSRMKGTPAEGNLRAKTGTLRWANSLSGYVTTAAGERLVFCLMLNRYAPTGGVTGRTALDELAVLLASFTGKSED